MNTAILFLLLFIHTIYGQNNYRDYKQPRRNGEPPRFTFPPKSQSYREGSSVTLSCEVSGAPFPSVSWMFNSVQIHESRKYQMNNKNMQLVIYPFLEADIGRYTCVAMNKLGHISTSADLKLIASTPPVIFESPQSQRVKPSERVVFRCKARGEPKPFISWFFEGSEIQNLAGHFQTTNEDTELIITHATRQDQGTYTCMGGNAVGSMTTDAFLTVDAPQLERVDQSLSDHDIKRIVQTATANVDKAIADTQSDTKQALSNPQNLIKLFRFSAPRAVELTKAREIYEESLRLIQKHVESGLRLPLHQLPTNVSYESILAVSHIQTIMELSGCMNGQFKETCDNMCFHSKYRSFDGQCTNLDNTLWGASQMPFQRLLPPIYENGFNTPVGWEKEKLYYGFKKPNARKVSLELIGSEQITAHQQYSSMLMQWGQFLDHDITFKAPALSRKVYSTGGICNRTCENIEPCYNILLPPGDPKYKTLKKGNVPCMEFDRSSAVCGSGETSPIFQRISYREQVNIVTSYIDASNVYGSAEIDSTDLRDLFSDHGLLRFDIVSSAQKPYLPFEKDSDMECRRNISDDNPIRCFLGGDFRANEQLGLTSIHTIWLREHNRIAGKLLEINPNWDGEKLYQEGRKIVGAIFQHITYSKWLPKVLGQNGFNHYIGDYKGYQNDVHPGISNSFATAAFRFGHTLINPKLTRLNNEFATIPEGDISLHEAIFAPERLLSEGGIDPIVRGLFASQMKLPRSDQVLNKELTELLFHREAQVPLDLAAVNIQRGRDHALPGYTEYRRYCNLTVPSTFEEMVSYVSNSSVIPKLKELYGHPGNIDLWVGGVIEKKLPDALVGATFSCIIGEQFKKLRDGDRFYYENPDVFSPLQLQQIKRYSFAKALCHNGDNIDRVQKDVFMYVGNKKSSYQKCGDIPDLNLNMWMSCCDGSCSAQEETRSKRNAHFYKQN